MTHEECRADILAREAVRDAAHPSTEYELRQQLADVSNERDEANNRHTDVLLCFGMMRDERDAMQIKLNASEARNAELEGLLKMFVENSDDHDVIELSLHALAQSAPATDEHGAGS